MCKLLYEQELPQLLRIAMYVSWLSYDILYLSMQAHQDVFRQLVDLIGITSITEVINYFLILFLSLFIGPVCIQSIVISVIVEAVAACGHLNGGKQQ